MLCLSDFELYSRWVPLTLHNKFYTTKVSSNTRGIFLPRSLFLAMYQNENQQINRRVKKFLSRVFKISTLNQLLLIILLHIFCRYLCASCSSWFWGVPSKKIRFFILKFFYYLFRMPFQGLYFGLSIKSVITNYDEVMLCFLGFMYLSRNAVRRISPCVFNCLKSQVDISATVKH